MNREFTYQLLQNYLLIGDEKQGEGANKQTKGICECFSNSIYVKYCLCVKKGNDDGVLMQGVLSLLAGAILLPALITNFELRLKNRPNFGLTFPSPV